MDAQTIASQVSLLSNVEALGTLVFNTISIIAFWASPLLFAIYFHFVIAILLKKENPLVAILAVAPVAFLIAYVVNNLVASGEWFFVVYFLGASLLGVLLGFLFPLKERKLKKYPL